MVLPGWGRRLRGRGGGGVFLFLSHVQVCKNEASTQFLHVVPQDRHPGNLLLLNKAGRAF